MEIFWVKTFFQWCSLGRRFPRSDRTHSRQRRPIWAYKDSKIYLQNFGSWIGKKYKICSAIFHIDFRNNGNILCRYVLITKLYKQDSIIWRLCLLITTKIWQYVPCMLAQPQFTVLLLNWLAKYCKCNDKYCLLCSSNLYDVWLGQIQTLVRALRKSKCRHGHTVRFWAMHVCWSRFHWN